MARRRFVPLYTGRGCGVRNRLDVTRQLVADNLIAGDEFVIAYRFAVVAVAGLWAWRRFGAESC